MHRMEASSVGRRHRALVVGARGAVGTVYAAALRRAGCEVFAFVRPARGAETVDGILLNRVSPTGSRSAERVTFTDVFTDVARASACDVDSIWLAVPADAIDDALLGDVVAMSSRATVVLLGPVEQMDRLVTRIDPDRLVRGSIGFLAWRTPMPGSIAPREQSTPAGFAWLAAAPAGFAGKGAREVAELVRRGGLATRMAPHMERDLAFETAVLIPVMAGLGSHGWKVRSFLRSSGPALEAARVALRTEEAALGVPSPWLHRVLLQPCILAILLRLALFFAPLDLEGFFRNHFDKLSAQSDRLLADMAARTEARGADATALRRLITR